jgi:hypothetical protein
MPRRPSAKQLAKAEERFKVAATNYFIGLGVRPGHFYEYELDTPAGLLHISIYGCWVATRFDDPKRGSVVTKAIGVRCNPYSGKWNHWYADGTLAALDPDLVIPNLSYYFGKLLTSEPIPARADVLTT